MPLPDFLSEFREKFLAFRKTPWFRVLYLVLLGLIVAQLFPFTLASSVACLTLFLMPITVFVIPYWLGERKARRFAVNAVPVFVLAILVVGLLETSALLGQTTAEELHSFPGFGSSPTMALSNGTVAPFQAPPNQDFAFRVRLTTTVNGTASDFSVHVNLTVIDGLARSEPSFRMTAENVSANTRNGSWFATSLPLGGSIYGYGFSVTDLDGNWTFAGPVLGPITASSAAFFGFFVYVTSLFMLIPFSFYYVIMFMWWYTVRMRRSRQRMMESGELAIPKTPAKSKRGKATKASAFTCTNCGADVSETDKKCPKCGAVFED